MLPAARRPAAFLGSRFGRRLFIMFCLAAMVPAAAVFTMTYRTAAADADASRLRALREGGKDFALGVYGRLQLADQALATADPETIARGGREPFLALYFTDVAAFARSRARPGTESSASSAVDPVRGPEAQLQVATGQDGIAVSLSRVAGDRVLVGRLDPAFLWGDSDDMGQDMRICMFAGRQRLFCGGHPGADGSDRLLAEKWELFLRARFAAESWTVVAVSGAGHRLRHYSGVLAPAAAGVLLFALLLSSVQIRRVLVPLSDLLRRIRSFEGGNTAVTVRTGEDEFGLLSRTFGEMQHRIGRQMDTLRALSDVDRLILEGAPLVDLIDLVAQRMRQAVGPATICVAVAAADAAGRTTLFVRRRDHDVTEEMPEAEGSGVPDVPAQRWHSVDELGAGGAHDACLSAGDREVFVIAPAESHGRIRVMLGFPERPRDFAEPLAQAAKLAEAIPVVVAFEERRQRLVFQARHDSLTQLPNRLATFEAVASAIAEAKRSGAGFAVAFLDLDRFKSINDGLGHAFGDELLVGVAQRIREALSADDFVGRFGGDEFCIVLAGAGDVASAERAMQRVVEAFARPVRAAGRDFLQRFSVGVAFYPVHGQDASTLIRNADVAMFHGKRAGGHVTQFFAPEMNAHAQSRVQMEKDLRDAIAAGAIEVHYQPRVDSRSGRVVGAEALARWTHPEVGPVPPTTFIPLAEDAGLIDDLGELVLRTACRQLAAWKSEGLALPLVAVNVSGRQLRSRQLPATLRAAIDAAGIESSELEIEITETILVRHGEAGDNQLQSIRDLGVTVAIDDFGTEYSSLSYLTDLPFDTLKIDRSFVRGMQDGNRAMAAVVRAIIGLARELDKHVVAEGVESMTEVAWLADLGCHTIQGYVYHRPLDAAALADVLRRAAYA